MNRRQIIKGLLIAISVQATATLPASAATYVEQILAQLHAQGFENIEVETTWLGRAHIQAMRRNVSREIVVNPNTGEILRDLWLSGDGTATPTITIGDDGDGEKTGSGKGDEGGSSGQGGGGEGSGDGGEGDGGEGGGGKGGDGGTGND